LPNWAKKGTAFPCDYQPNVLQRLIQKQPIPAKEMTSQIRGKIAWRTSTRIPQKESA